MQMETARRVIARGAVCLIAGAGIGGSADYLMDHLGPSESQQIAGIEACAKQLGSSAVSKDVIPSSCYQDSPKFIPYYYDQAGNLFYSLPTANHLRVEAQNVPAEAQAQDQYNKHLSRDLGGIFAVVSFASYSLFRRKPQPPRPTLRLVK